MSGLIVLAALSSLPIQSNAFGVLTEIFCNVKNDKNPLMDPQKNSFTLNEICGGNIILKRKSPILEVKELPETKFVYFIMSSLGSVDPNNLPKKAIDSGKIKIIYTKSFFKAEQDKLEVEDQTVVFDEKKQPCGIYFLIAVMQNEVGMGKSPQYSTLEIPVNRKCSDQGKEGGLDLKLEIVQEPQYSIVLKNSKLAKVEGLTLKLTNKGTLRLASRTLLRALELMAMVGCTDFIPEKMEYSSLQEFSDKFMENYGIQYLQLKGNGKFQFLEGLEMALIDENTNLGKSLEPGKSLDIDLGKLVVSNPLKCPNEESEALVMVSLDLEIEGVTSNKQDRTLFFPVQYEKSRSRNSKKKDESCSKIIEDPNDGGQSATVMYIGTQPQAFQFNGYHGYIHQLSILEYMKAKHLDRKVRMIKTRLIEYLGDQKCPDATRIKGIVKDGVEELSALNVMKNMIENVKSNMGPFPELDDIKVAEDIKMFVNLVDLEKDFLDAYFTNEEFKKFISTFISEDAKLSLMKDLGGVAIYGLSFKALFALLSIELAPQMLINFFNTDPNIQYSGDPGAGNNYESNREIYFPEGNECNVPCKYSAGCVKYEQLCDSIQDCMDGSDEQNCNTFGLEPRQKREIQQMNDTKIGHPYGNDFMGKVPMVDTEGNSDIEWVSQGLLKSVGVNKDGRTPPPSVSGNHPVSPSPGMNRDQEDLEPASPRTQNRGVGEMEANYRGETSSRMNPGSNRNQLSTSKKFKLIMKLYKAVENNDFSQFKFIPKFLEESFQARLNEIKNMSTEFWDKPFHFLAPLKKLYKIVKTNFYQETTTSQELKMIQDVNDLRKSFMELKMDIKMTKLFVDKVEKVYNSITSKENLTTIVKYFEGNKTMEKLVNIAVEIGRTILKQKEDIVKLLRLSLSPELNDREKILKEGGEAGKPPSEDMHCQKAAMRYVKGLLKLSNEFNNQETIREDFGMEDLALKNALKPVIFWTNYKGGIYKGYQSLITNTMIWDKVAVCSCLDERREIEFPSNMEQRTFKSEVLMNRENAGSSLTKYMQNLFGENFHQMNEISKNIPQNRGSETNYLQDLAFGKNFGIKETLAGIGVSKAGNETASAENFEGEMFSGESGSSSVNNRGNSIESAGGISIASGGISIETGGISFETAHGVIANTGTAAGSVGGIANAGTATGSVGGIAKAGGSPSSANIGAQASGTATVANAGSSPSSANIGAASAGTATGSAGNGIAKAGSSSSSANIGAASTGTATGSTGVHQQSVEHGHGGVASVESIENSNSIENGR